MRRKSDIPFAEDSSRLFLPWMSMLMVFMAVLTVAGGMAAYMSLSDWNKSVSGSMTVQIPVVDNKGVAREEIDKDIENALTVLRSSPGILGAVILSDEQMNTLMTPWIGEQTNISDLPLPKLIDVTIDTDNPPKLDQLTTDLTDQVPTAVLDSHRIWLANLIKLAGGMMKLTGFILLLLISTTALTVIYSTKTSLAVHKSVISLVHMMGANDFYIAIQYANRSFKLSLIGGLLGLLMALPVILGISYFFQNIAADFMVDGGFSANQWLGLGLLPFAFALLSFITTLHIVNSSLKKAL